MSEQLRLTGESEPEAVRNRDGSTRIVKRASSGMFARKADPPSKEEAQAAITAKVTEVDAEGSSVLERILDNQIAAATTPAAQPVIDKLGNPILVDGKPVLVTDPKVMMASAKAAQVVLRSAGLEQPEKQPVFQNKVEIVIIQPPDLMHKEIVEEKPRPPLVPHFAEVTEIHTNPAPDLTVMPKPAPSDPKLLTEKVSVEWIMAQPGNKAKVFEASRGKSLSSLGALAEKDPPIRIYRSTGKVTRGFLRLSEAWARSAQMVEVEIIPE
jgi:hypothetical protein